MSELPPQNVPTEPEGLPEGKVRCGSCGSLRDNFYQACPDCGGLGKSRAAED